MPNIQPKHANFEDLFVLPVISSHGSHWMEILTMKPLCWWLAGWRTEWKRNWFVLEVVELEITTLPVDRGRNGVLTHRAKRNSGSCDKFLPYQPQLNSLTLSSFPTGFGPRTQTCESMGLGIQCYHRSSTYVNWWSSELICNLLFIMFIITAVMLVRNNRCW